MASGNPFDVLGDDDNDDPSLLIAAQQQKAAAKKPAPAAAAPKDAAKFPSKPVPPAQAVREAKSSGGTARGGGVGRGGQGRGRGGYVGGNRDYGNENVAGGYGYGVGGEDGEIRKPIEREPGVYGGPRRPYVYRGGGRRGGFANGEVVSDPEQQRPRRIYERKSGTGRGNELKREGSGRGNWGTMGDDVIAMEGVDAQTAEDKAVLPEKRNDREGPVSEVNVDNKEDEARDKEEKEEDKEMTLEEYEKIREEKRKALLAMKMEERKVDVDKEFESMTLLSVKKGNDDAFIKLGPSKETRRTKDNAEYGDNVKKPVSINEFLKPAEGGRYYSSGGRGRGNRGGRGGRGGPYTTGEGGSRDKPEANIRIEDPGQFPTLGGN